MRRWPAPIAAAALVASLGCTGDGRPTDAAARRDPAVQATSSAEAAVLRAADVRLRDARMQVSTDWSTGDLAAFCTGDACTEDPGARPERFVRAADTRLVSFVVPRRPADARVEFLRAGTRKVVRTTSLHPATLMSMVARVEPGRYVLRLAARWGSREARWVFGLVVPAGD